MGKKAQVVAAPPPQRVGPSFEEQLALQESAQKAAAAEAEKAAQRAREAEERAEASARATITEIGQLTGKTVKDITETARLEAETKVPALTQEYKQRLEQFDPSKQLTTGITEAQKGISDVANLFTGKSQEAAKGFGEIYQIGTELAGEKLKEYSQLAGTQQAEAAEKATGTQRLALVEAAGLQRQSLGLFEQAAQRASRRGARQMMAMTRNISNMYNPEFQRLAAKPPTQRSTLLEETMAKNLYNV